MKDQAAWRSSRVSNFASKVLTNTEASPSFMGMNSNVKNDRFNEVTRNSSTCGSYALTVVTDHKREAYDKVFNHLDMLHAPLEGKVLILTIAK
ncbi:hypothetical protein Tco_0025112 [Tanacetum coccineum]